MRFNENVRGGDRGVGLESADILILSNGPGELATWVRPVVRELRRQLGEDRQQVRISLVLSPCANASGREAAIARSYPEIDRVQAAQHFYPFLLFGKTVERWDWRDRGVVVFLGGDQFYPVVISKRLGYRTVLYGEWDTRWHRWIDRFAVMQPQLVARAPKAYTHKFTVVGDLMAEVGSAAAAASPSNQTAPLIGILPGSKAAKLAQGVPLGLAIAKHLRRANPNIRLVIPVAPTLDLATLAKFADPSRNPMAAYFENAGAELVIQGDRAYLKMPEGIQIELYTQSPAYDLLAQCSLCLTTVGANTAELGALAVPMMVLIPTQQLDAMRAWDGLPGLLTNLPGVGPAIARLVNAWFLRQGKLLAWPNIWAGRAVVPELVGKLEAGAIADLVLDWLSHPEKLAQMREELRAIRGTPGAAAKLARIVGEELR